MGEGDEELCACMEEVKTRAGRAPESGACSYLKHGMRSPGVCMPRAPDGSLKKKLDPPLQLEQADDGSRSSRRMLSNSRAPVTAASRPSVRLHTGGQLRC